MVRVVAIDHLVIRVSDYEKSKAFYGRLFDFLGFEISDEYENAIGWTNGKTRFWIGPADEKGRKRKYRIGDVGFHYYAFQLRSRKMSTRCRPSFRRPGRVSSIPPMNIMTTITRCSFSTRTG